MKDEVIGFNGSPRKGGNTELLINHVFDELHKEGIDTELVQIGGKAIRGCNACMICREKKNQRCAIEGDMVNNCIAKMIEVDGIILGSTVYFADITPEIKALIDRAGYVAGANGNFLKRKVGAAVIAVRRGGAIHKRTKIQKETSVIPIFSCVSCVSRFKKIVMKLLS